MQTRAEEVAQEAADRKELERLRVENAELLKTQCEGVLCACFRDAPPAIEEENKRLKQRIAELEAQAENEYR